MINGKFIELVAMVSTKSEAKLGENPKKFAETKSNVSDGEQNGNRPQ